MDNTRIADKFKEIKKLEKKKDKLLEELERSVAIKMMWPEAFDRGSVRARIEGNQHGHPSNTKFLITNGEGICREFPITEVPAVLILFHTRNWTGYEANFKLKLFDYLIREGREDFIEEVPKSYRAGAFGR